MYTLYFLDRSTERGFVRHVMSKEKGEILDAILDMSDALTIEARSSISFSGKDIRMERLLTDREPGLTSHEGIAEFLAKRVAHEIAAADAVNQTPFLDGFIRRVQDVASSLLDAAGLSEEFWEFAINAAVRLTNMMPTSRHHLNHSADQRWTGQRQNLTRLETFGADVYPLQENHKKDGKDKLSPGAGGNGRFRLMGVSSKPELIERGSLILDTTHKPLPLLRCLRNYQLNENMAEVREYKYPVSSWRKLEAEIKNETVDVSKLDMVEAFSEEIESKGAPTEEPEEPDEVPDPIEEELIDQDHLSTEVQVPTTEIDEEEESEEPPGRTLSGRALRAARRH